MRRVIKAIEEKMADYEATIILKDYEIEKLKKELAENATLIEEQTNIIARLERELDCHGVTERKC